MMLTRAGWLCLAYLMLYVAYTIAVLEVIA